MKKLYMLMIIIFSIFVVSDVNAQYLSFSDFKDIEKFNFPSQPNLQETYANPDSSGLVQLSSGFYGSELNNTPSNNHNYIIFGWDFSAYNTNRHNSSNSIEYSVSNLQTSNTLWISYNNNKQYNCDYLNGYIYCPYDKGTKIDTLMIRTTGAVYGNTSSLEGSWFYFKSRIKITYYYGNLVNNQSIQDSIDNQTDIISNDDTTGNANDFSSDISNFNVPNDSHAFDILGSLQSFVGNIQVSGSCSRISVPIPFTDKNFTLPCMTTDVYSVHFREIVIIWQLICRGVGYYYILVNVLKLVKETLDPFNFKLEVLDL